MPVLILLSPKTVSVCTQVAVMDFQEQSSINEPGQSSFYTPEQLQLDLPETAWADDNIGSFIPKDVVKSILDQLWDREQNAIM